MSTAVVSVRLDDEVKTRLDALSAATGRLLDWMDPTGPCQALTGPLAGLWRLRVGITGLCLIFAIAKLSSSPWMSATGPPSAATDCAHTEMCQIV